MRQLRVELGRLRARPAIAAVLVVTALLTALIAFSAAYDTRPVSATERATAEQLLERQQLASQQEYERCLDDPVQYFGPEGDVEDCETVLPSIDWFLSRAPLDVLDEVENRGTVLMVLLAGMAVLVGATFAGADWASGSMGTQLLFQPRRLLVWAAKALAAALACTLAAAVALAAFWGTLAVVAANRDIGVPDAVWTSVLETSGRSLALVAAAALGSYALTMLLRRTVATLGLLFAYAVVGEGLAASLPIDKMSQWSMPQNIMAWLYDGVVVYDESLCGLGQDCDPTYTLSLAHGASYLGVLLLLAIVLSVVLFRRRDVP